MKKSEILRCIFHGADLYKENVLDQTFLFVYQSDGTGYQYAEVIFQKGNYQHLTGVEVPGVQSHDFFERCLSRRIAERDIREARDGTTPMKLAVLERAIREIGKAPMLGIYDESRIYLKTDRLIGGVAWCIGFVQRAGQTQPLLPNTLLREDIRNVSRRPTHRIVLSLKKEKGNPLYSELLRVAKDIDPDEILRAAQLTDRVAIHNTDNP